jgi:hypothetical protein
MKRLFLFTALLLSAVLINAQTLEEIVKNYSAANKLDKVSSFKTIKITGKMSMMGMEMPTEIWMKNPSKIKSVTNINGQDMVQAYDGTKGYMINPMSGSSDPVELPAEQVTSLEKSNIFTNYMADYLKQGLLKLEGEESVNGKPAFKILANMGTGTTAHMFIDKETFLLVKTTADVTQNGQAITVESYPSNYTDNGGVFLPMKTTASFSGMDMVTEFTKVEVDVPMDDAIFKLK